VISSGSGIDFLVSYAEAEGALAEPVPEGAILVLPDELRAVLNLPEEIGLTEDPETAREDDFLLVAAGHPLLMAAAGTVLERGDVGCSSLPRSVGLPPTPSALEERAREQIHPDHGRIDVNSTPEASNVIVLRVGALLTYSISIDERVQELEEVWVAADSGHAVPGDLRERLCTAALEPGVATATEVSVGESVARAHGLLRARAQSRVEDLARQTSVRLRGQLDVVDDYYRRVMSSIDERLARASRARTAMLEEQGEASKREWARRRAEVADDLTPSFEVRPFRLHLVAVPSYTIPAVVRRGPRLYQLTLRYIPAVSSFLPVPCPLCGEQAVLVAGKDRLGCRSCMTPVRPVGPTDQAEDGEPASAPSDRTDSTRNEPDQAPGPGRRSVPSDRQPSARATRSESPPRTAHSQGTSAPKRSSGRVTPKRAGGGKPATSQPGVRMAMSFWSSVHSGELRPRDAVPDSPMRALLRLYGALGPALVIGVEDVGRMTAVTASSVSAGPDGVSSTDGDLRCSGEENTPFTLYWRSGSRSSLLEVQGFPLESLGPLLARRDELGTIYRHRFRDLLVPPPEPIVELDLTAGVLLRQAAHFAGLGYATRCLAAWWYVSDGADEGRPSIDDFGPPPATAAAVESVVGKRLGMKLTAPALAERYECSIEDVRRSTKLFQTVARTCTDRRW
jgi:hypothetical protein